MAKVINTADIKMQESLTAGKDKNYEIKKKDDDFPMQEIDQSKTISTHNLIPNKRPVNIKDIKTFLKKRKNIEEAEKEEKPKKKENKLDKEKE